MKKRLLIASLALLMLLSLTACGMQPADDDTVDEPPMEQEVIDSEDQRDEITGDNVTGIGTGDVENTDVGVVTPNPDAAKDEKPDTQKPEQDKTPVEDNKDDEQDKDTETSKPDDTNKDEDTTPPKQEDTTPPVTTPDEDEDKTPSGSGNSGSGNTSGNNGSSGTAMYNGHPVRAFPAGTDINSLSPAEPFEDVYIGDILYGWTGAEWVVVDTSTPPNQSTIIEGDPFSGPSSPFN